MRFMDRADAGRQLGNAVSRTRWVDPIVLGLPRGGVPVAREVARALDAPLDVWIVRKVGVPWEPELGVGAVAEGDSMFLDHVLMDEIGLSRREVDPLLREKRAEVRERVHRFRGSRPAPRLEGRTVVLVDDGIATGGTMRAAIQSIQQMKPHRLVLAVPMAAPDAIHQLGSLVDEMICLSSDPWLSSVGEAYRSFPQVSDEEVAELLAEEETRSEDRIAHHGMSEEPTPRGHP